MALWPRFKVRGILNGHIVVGAFPTSHTFAYAFYLSSLAETVLLPNTKINVCLLIHHMQRGQRFRCSVEVFTVGCTLLSGTNPLIKPSKLTSSYELAFKALSDSGFP